MADEVDDEIAIANAALGAIEDDSEELEQEVDPVKLGEILVQVNRQKGILRELQIYDDRYLLVSQGDIDGSDMQKYRLNLAFVSPDPDHTRLIDWKWLYTSLVLGVITSAIVILAITDMLTMDYAMIAGTIVFTLTVLATLVFVYRLRDEFTFKGMFGGTGMFVVENKRPTQQLFDLFFVQLQQAIERAAQAVPINDRLVGELKMTRHLRDKGIIDDEAYTASRTRIFKHEEYRA